MGRPGAPGANRTRSPPPRIRTTTNPRLGPRSRSGTVRARGATQRVLRLATNGACAALAPRPDAEPIPAPWVFALVYPAMLVWGIALAGQTWCYRSATARAAETRTQK
ncbi:hypothetical protein GCM10009854_17600 [Saccharopolyspora halophila]|uniref:Uncharacterized protein n=1 Tax=Saccharopolyspora halophila TaxID=405551 RepID=A0ABP5SYW4_9PSEU